MARISCLATLFVLIFLASSALQIRASGKHNRHLLGYDGYSGSSGSSGSSSSPSISTPNVPSTSGPVTSGGTGFGRPTGRGSFSFWRAHVEKWPKIISTIAKLVRIFGGRSGTRYPGHLSLKDALDASDNDSYTALAQQATASLLNSYAVEGFAFTPGEVKAQFDAALDSPDAAAVQAAKFADLNEQV